MADVAVTGTVKKISGPPKGFIVHLADPPPDGFDRPFLTDEPDVWDVIRTAYGAGKTVTVTYDDASPAKATRATSP